MTRSTAGLYNDGLIGLGPDAASGATQTIVVTGMARSGTSMAARALLAAGVDMGALRDEVVYEDAEIGLALEGHGPSLASLVAERNGRAPVWGFKRPHLFAQVGPEFAATLRNPRFVITFRDIAAIARRNSISELFEQAAALRWAADDLRGCLDFALALPAPALLVSYEKALQQPEAFVDRLLAFCGLAVAASVRSSMVLSIEADRGEYVRAARRVFDGYIDGAENGVVFGWCRQIGLDAPVMLEVVVHGHPPIQTLANVDRPDLSAAGIGFTGHGFRLDVSPFVATGDERVSARVLHRQFELLGSGRTIEELSA